MKVERNGAVPMPDGVVLRADVFRPCHGGPCPMLAMRTPYNKKGEVRPVRQRRVHRRVWQDARGHFQFDGQWGPFVRYKTHDAGNRYDMVEWAAKQRGSTGRVAMFGLRQILGYHERRQRGRSQYVRQRRSKAAMAPAVPL